MLLLVYQGMICTVKTKTIPANLTYIDLQTLECIIILPAYQYMNWNSSKESIITGNCNRRINISDNADVRTD